jgi:hypothetical protein
MQAIIVIYAWCMVRLATARKALNSLRSPFFRLRHKSKPFNFHPQIETIFDFIETRKLTQSTIAFLVDLQEAQCFFIIAAQIAILYALPQTPTFNGIEDWDTLFVNHVFIRYLASVGPLPIVVAQTSLRLVSLDSVYTLFLSTLAVVLSTAASNLSFPDVEKVYDMFRDHNQLEECGGNPSLTTFCVTHDATDVVGSAYGALGQDLFFSLKYITITIICVLWVCKGYSASIHADTSTEAGRSWFQRQYRSAYADYFEKHEKSLACVIRVFSYLVTVFLVAAELLLVTYICSSLAFLNSVLSLPKMTVWNIGQIIAVLVWAPVLLKYIYTTFCKFTFQLQSCKYVG